jgi:hypothetical protein
MTSTRSTTHRLIVVTAAVAAFGLTAPVSPAAAQPLPTGAGIVRVSHVNNRVRAAGCATKVRALTERYKKAGMTGHAAHVAAQLTLGCRN